MIRIVLLSALLLSSLGLIAADIEVDGEFNESIWNRATELTRFKTFKPDIGFDASEKTSVLITNDSLNIYFAIRCYDNEPDKIMANISNRDNIGNDDSFTIEMDLGGRANSNIFFRVNPLGIQEDGVVFQSDVEDLNPDKIWYSKGFLTEMGYQVEIAIPFSSLRFKWREIVEINMGFKRKIYRKSEIVVFPEVKKEISNRLIQREAVRFTNIPKQKVLELIPSITYTYERKLENNEWNTVQNEIQPGITAKIGLSSDLILDVTYNPDFSQIESDEGQIDINLRNSLFFPEKRPFFQEGVEHFRFGSQNWYDMPFKHLIHTRNIVDPIYGIKLTGKLGENYSIASIISRDQYLDQKTDFQILRARRIFKDDNYLGLVYSAKECSNGYNRLGGIDGTIRFDGRNSLEYYYYVSSTKDSLNTRSGSSFEFFYRFKDRIHSLKIGYAQIDKEFETQTGYLERNGLRIIPIAYKLILPVKLKWITNAGIIFHTRQKQDLYSQKHEHSTNLGIQLNFSNSGYIQAGRRFSTEIFQNIRFNTSAFQSYYFMQFSKILSIDGYIRWGNQIYYDPIEPFQGYGWVMNHTISVTPTDQFKIKISGRYCDFYRSSDDEFIYDYKILRLSSTYQLNKYLFIRTIGEYNFYKEKFSSNLLISFNYIPGTVFQLGYNLNAERNLLDRNMESNEHLKINQKLLFLKVSYLFN